MNKPVVDGEHAPPAASFVGRPVLVESLGIAVRQLRERQGWSQEVLAEHSGLNRSYVGEVERGQVAVSVVTAQKIAAAFSVSIVDLFAQCESIEHLRTCLGAKASCDGNSIKR